MNDDFLKLASERYSVRKFKDQKVNNEDLDKIIKSALLAPTACNLQPFRLIIVQSDEALIRFRRCTECHFNAPNAIIVLANKNECWKRSYDGKTSADIDASIVTTHMMLEAYSLGVGSTWIMYFIPEAVITEFNVPDDYEVVSILLLGYPSDISKPEKAHTKSKTKNDVVMYDIFKG